MRDDIYQELKKEIQSRFHNQLAALELLREEMGPCGKTTLPTASQAGEASGGKHRRRSGSRIRFSRGKLETLVNGVILRKNLRVFRTREMVEYIRKDHGMRPSSSSMSTTLYRMRQRGLLAKAQGGLWAVETKLKEMGL